MFPQRSCPRPAAWSISLSRRVSPRDPQAPGTERSWSTADIHLHKDKAAKMNLLTVRQPRSFIVAPIRVHPDPTSLLRQGTNRRPIPPSGRPPRTRLPVLPSRLGLGRPALPSRLSLIALPVSHAQRVRPACDKPVWAIRAWTVSRQPQTAPDHPAPLPLSSHGGAADHLGPAVLEPNMPGAGAG